MRNFELNCYSHIINSDSVVYDIGAHTGETSLIFSKHAAKHIHAFEPSIFNFEKLKKNTKHINNISTYDVAFFDKNYTCTTRFRDCNQDSIQQDMEQQIKYAVIEDFINEKKIELPDFIKIDIEGMESILLNTLKFIFKNKRPFIYVEIHAKPKELDVQNYIDCPHWIWPEDGGFNFNDLKNLNYSIFCEKNRLLNLDKDWNPDPGDHIGRLLFPNEKLTL